MENITGASCGPGSREPDPTVPALTGLDPSREEIDIGGGKMVLRFHPLGKKVKDGVPRCAACGQIDEDGYHEAQWCPAMGGDWPFDTSTLKLSLKADKGYRCDITARITLRKWLAINAILNAQGPSMTTPSREEAPELKACPFCGVPLFVRSGVNPSARCDTVDCWMKARAIGIPTDDPRQVAAWNTRADLANREPSEGDVERVMLAIYSTDHEGEMAESGIEYGIFRRAALRAINAWRNP